MAIVSYPTINRNYCLFDDGVKKRIQNGEKELPVIKQSLANPKSEDEVVEDLYVLNLMLDNGIKTEKVAELYPELSKYNQTDSPNVQTFLAGIYRKTKIPDAFGPLVSMLIRNSINSAKDTSNSDGSFSAQNIYPQNIYPQNIYPFDPNEEIGGAILDYLA